jgi:hypothetical protein
LHFNIENYIVIRIGTGFPAGQLADEAKAQIPEGDTETRR